MGFSFIYSMSLNSLSEASISCSICLSNSNDDLISLPCNHHYHKKCISNNYIFEITRNNKTYYKCPECRVDISMDTMSNLLHDDRHTITTFSNSHYQGIVVSNTPIINQRLPIITNQRQTIIENSPLIMQQQISICRQHKNRIIGIICVFFIAIVFGCIIFFFKLHNWT